MEYASYAALMRYLKISKKVSNVRKLLRYGSCKRNCSRQFQLYKCNSIVDFTTYCKFRCCCIHCLFGVNECQQLVYTHIPIYANLTLIPNTHIVFSLTRCSIHEYKTGNDVSEFTHSNWIILSYYSSPKHKSLIPKYLIHSSHFCTQ